MTDDKNSRLALYKTLVSSKNKELSGAIKEYTPEEFDNLLAQDKEFQKNLFLDLRDYKMETDEQSFLKKYVSPTPVAAPAAAAPAVSGVSKKQEKPPAAPQPEKTMWEKAKAVGSAALEAFKTAGSIAKIPLFKKEGDQLKEVKADDEKIEQLYQKSQKTSETGYGGREAALGEYETLAQEKVSLDKEIQKYREPKLAKESLPEPPPAQMLQQAKALEAQTTQAQAKAAAYAERESAKIIRALHVNPSLEKEVFVTLDDGTKKVNPVTVEKLSREIGARGGVRPGGYAENLVRQKLSAALNYQLIPKEKLTKTAKEIYEGSAFDVPVVDPQKLPKSVQIPLAPISQMDEDIQKDFYKNLPSIEEKRQKAKDQFGTAKKIASQEYVPKKNEIKASYDSAIETLKRQIVEDVDIAKFAQDYDARVIASLQQAVNSSLMTREQAQKEYEGEGNKKTRQQEIQKLINQKYGQQYAKKYNTYLTEISTLNNRYNSRMRRQADEIQRELDSDVDRMLERHKANYKMDPKLEQKIRIAYDKAGDALESERMQKLRDKDLDASKWSNFINTTLKGLGEGLESTAFTLGMEDLQTFGRLLAENHPASDLTIESWDDVGFSNEKFTRFVQSAGQIFGRMAPGLAAGGTVAAVTGGMGLSVLPSMLLTAVPSAAFETADIMGSIAMQELAASGDIVKAKKASDRALKSQIMVAPLYVFDGLPFFPKVLKGIKPFRRPLANAAVRAGVGMGIDLTTETMQEVPQNIFEEVILKGKDPTFAELYENLTFEKIANTSASVLAITPLAGAGNIVEGGREEIKRIAAKNYYAKQILSQASHPALMTQNQAQFLTQLYDQKGKSFAGQMVSVLLHKGNIDRNRAEVLAKKLEAYDQFSKSYKGENPILKQATFVLYDRYIQAKNSKNEEAAANALAELQKFQKGKGAKLIMLRLPGGDVNIYTYDDINSLMDDEAFQAVARDDKGKYSAVFEITPFVQTTEEIKNDPQLQQILNRFDAIKNAEEETEDQRDEKIRAAQERTNFKPGPVISQLPVEYQAVLDAVRSKERGVTPDEISGTMRYLHDMSKIFSKMFESTTKNLTNEQIREAIADLEQAMDDLGAYDDSLAFSDEEMPIVEEEEQAGGQTIPEESPVYVPSDEDVAADEKAGKIEALTFESEESIPDYMKPYMDKAIRFKKDGKSMIQLMVPASLVQYYNSQAAAPTQAAPAEEAAAEAAAEEEVTAETEPTETQKPAEEKPKAKVVFLTDEDVIDSLSDEEYDAYNKFLVSGKTEMADRFLQHKRRVLIDKEAELIAVGQISEKVRQSFTKAGIDVELLSADEFVQKLKEAGESASRTQEGVFDDVRGKIFINKDALQLGWGTTVVWHEAIHPIMNIIHNSNKALYDKIHKGILANAKAKPEGQMADVIEWVNGRYNRPRDTDATRKDEIIVETLARLASGRMSFSELQPTLRQQFIDLINRIGRILGFSKAEVSDMKAIKDLAKKITETIKEGRNLSEIVGAENIGKYKRTGPMTARMAASLSRETQDRVVAGKAVGTRKPTAKKSPDLAYNKDLLIGLEATKANPALYKFNAILVASYDIMYPVLPQTIKTYLNGIYKTLNKYHNEVDTLRDEIADLKKEIVNITTEQQKLKKTEAAKLATKIIAGEVKKGEYGRLLFNLRKKIDRLERLTQKDGLLSKERERVRKEIENYAKEKMTMQMADRIYKEFIGITQSNLEALVNLFPARLREVAKLWYDGANLIAQGFAKSYKTSIEQAAAVLAVFSPQKDWFMNISLAERLMNIYNNMMDYKFDDAMAANYMKRSGEPELTIDEKTGEEKWTGGAVPLLDEEGEHIEIDGVLQFKNWDNEKAKARAYDAAKILKTLRGKSLRELLDAGQLDKAARFVRMYSEVYDSPNFSFYTPDGRRGYESRSEKGTLRKIAWGGYNTIEKALRIMEATEKNKMDIIHNELGEMHKVRSFYNNIADPLSKDGHVTMDTHAIAAILWKALSGASFEVTQNFGGAGTKSEASIGSNGLYPVFAEAYREAANNLGYLPREIQSITWEAVRMLFKAKWKGNKENVKKIGNIWAKFRNGELTIEQAREQIWSLATAGARGTIEEAIRNGEGVGSPDWAEILDSGLDPERVRKANDAVRLSMAGGVRYDGKRGVGRPGDVTSAAGVVPGSAEGGKPGSLELKLQPSLGGRGQLVNVPLGVSKKLENVASQNEDVITTKISVAPFYSVKIKTIEEANAILSSPAFIRYKKDIQEFAKAAGIKIKNIDEGIGGFAFDDGTAVKEATTVLEVTGSWQNIVDFAALSGALTPEVQESTIAGRYVEENTKEHNADEYTVQIDNTEAAFQAAIDAGFDTAGFTLLNDEIRFYNVFKYRIKDIFEKIDTFASKYTEYGGSIKGEAKRSVQSEYIDYDDRANALAKIAADALQPGSNWAGLRDRIDFAQKRNEAFRDWKKVKKSKRAGEYENLRREQIEAGSQGEVLSDKKLERIKKLEKFFETPLTTVVSTDQERYEEAKAEIDAIAGDVAKMVNGGFSSPFNIKRPDRAAIKVVRWYSLNPNLLGDGSRVNVIVNTDSDADYLFEQIRDRFTIPGDRVEYEMPTPLGYPKRLVEIRTTNGKIAEIQVMTPQGYLAKDGVKYFPDDKKDLAREALGEIQERLGWNIPDGVGHYFYEIDRDTNVQNNLRKEAVRVSNLYYEAFLNPKSTLSDSEFRKAISDFKDRVDNADKSKWDTTNKGKAPAELVEYLGGKPQASLGGRPSAPSFAELDEILDMSPVKSRAAREKLIDQYGKETVDRMIEISRNFGKIINGLEEQGVVEKDCP